MKSHQLLNWIGIVISLAAIGAVVFEPEVSSPDPSQVQKAFDIQNVNATAKSGREVSF